MTVGVVAAGVTVAVVAVALSAPPEDAGPGMQAKTSDLWSAEPTVPPAGTPLNQSCVRLTVDTTPHEACMDARSVEVPAFWRVGGRDFVAYPDWDNPEASPAPPALTVETVDAYLQRHRPKGFGCGVAPRDARTLIIQMGDALEARYRDDPPPIMYVGCSNGLDPVLFGDLQTPNSEDAANHLYFKSRGDRLEIVA